MRLVPALAVLVVALFPALARAEAPPDADAVRKAASAFDAGSQAYRAESYSRAAAHFEAADEAVPSARALRMAIRSREKAEQLARAATLAARAASRYRNDDKTRKLAKSTIDRHADALHRLKVTCSVACVVALGTTTVAGRARKRWTVFVAPGEVSVSASFVEGDATADAQRIDARAGGNNSLSFFPAAGVGTDSATPPPAPIEPQPDEGPDAASPPEEDPDEGEANDDGSSWIESPGVSIALLIATAGLGGVTIWSGVDALSNPGTETVEEACKGQGTDCPEYQQGLDNQLRTNVLIGATAGVGALTVIFMAFVTDWGGDDDAEEDMAATLSLEPLPLVGPDVAGIAIGGSF
jgi:hypothetical protein